MLNLKIEYSLAKRKHIPQLVKLMNNEYSRKKEKSYFIWQYFESPLQTVLVCAFHNDKVIGMFGLQKKELSNNLKIGQIIDILIAPEYRKKGIFKKMSEMAFEKFNDIEIFCVFPNLNGKNACEKSLGFKKISKINTMVLDTKHSSENTMVYPKISQNKLISFNIDPIQYKWRFTKNPCYKYKKISIKNDTYAVCKFFTDPITNETFGDIVKINDSHNNSKEIKSLISLVIKDFSKNNITCITTWALPHTKLFKTLLSINFTEKTAERYFCILTNDKYKYLYDISNWELSQCDTEIF